MPAFAVSTCAMSSDPVHVIDPANRSGKIRVPRDQTQPTLGLAEWCAAKAVGRTKDVSLCMLFQKGRCLAGDGCHQIHADRLLVEQLRQRSAGGACCAEHSPDCDEEDPRFQVQGLTIKIQLQDTRVVEVPVKNFARTLALSKAVYAPAPVSFARLCRLSMQGRCKYGRDCKNLHLCRAWAQVFDAGNTLSRPLQLAPLSAPRQPQQDLAPLFSSGQPQRSAVHVITTNGGGLVQQQQFGGQQMLRQGGGGLTHVVRTFVRPGQVPSLSQSASLQPPMQGAVPQQHPGLSDECAPPGLRRSASPFVPGLGIGGSRVRSQSESDAAYDMARVLARQYLEQGAELQQMQLQMQQEQEAALQQQQQQQQQQVRHDVAPLTHLDADSSCGLDVNGVPDSPPALLPGSPGCDVTSPMRIPHAAADYTPPAAAQPVSGVMSPSIALRRFRKAFPGQAVSQSLTGNPAAVRFCTGQRRGSVCGAGFSLAKLRSSADSEGDVPPTHPTELLCSPTAVAC